MIPPTEAFWAESPYHHASQLHLCAKKGPLRIQTVSQHIYTRIEVTIIATDLGNGMVLWFDCRYPIFTMLGQSLGSMVVAMTALCFLLPDVFVDTTGYAFTFIMAKILGGCRTVAYVHYPTISTVRQSDDKSSLVQPF